MNTVVGLVAVFAVLIFLILVIMAFGKMGGNKNQEPVKEKKRLRRQFRRLRQQQRCSRRMILSCRSCSGWRSPCMSRRQVQQAETVM